MMPTPPHLTPLTSEDATLRALEATAAMAQGELVIALRTLSPRMPLRTEALRERGLNTWQDLLAWLSRRDVQLHLLFGDGDPLFASPRHRRAWLAASGFANVASREAQILCAPHGQRPGWLWQHRLRSAQATARNRLAATPKHHLTNPQRQALAEDTPPQVLMLNQSFLVADGARAVIGGFSLDERRQPEEWHDVAIEIADSDFAGALRGFFGEIWDAALDTRTPLLTPHPKSFRETARPQSRPTLRLLRTQAQPTKGALALTAKTRYADFEQYLEQAFESAKRSVYIETPAFRHRGLAEALVRAAEANPTLQLVLILSPAADRMPFGGALPGTQARAAWLQDRVLTMIDKSFGPRAAVLKVHAPEGRNLSDPARPAPPIPLPGQLVLVDSETAVLGSAALTTRALTQDTEAGVFLRDAEVVEQLRHARATHWLGEAAHDPALASIWAATESTRLRPLPPPSEAPRDRRNRLPEALF